MTDLTEHTWYYCKMKDGDIQMLERGSDYFLSGDVPLLNNEVKQVLAPVPSYDDWKALMDLYKEADIIIKKSDKENIKIKTDCRNVAQKLLQVKPELKEWLEANYKEYL